MLYIQFPLGYYYYYHIFFLLTSYFNTEVFIGLHEFPCHHISLLAVITYTFFAILLLKKTIALSMHYLHSWLT